MNREGTDAGTTVIELLAWVEVNKKRLLIGAAVAGLLAGGGVIYRWQLREQEQRASAALLRLQVASGGPGRAIPVGDLERVAADHSGTAAAARAILLSGEAYFRDGRVADALSAFQRASALLKDESLQAIAAFGIATCQDALGKTQEATTAYQQLISSYPRSAQAAQARLALGGLLESQGDAAGALQMYNQLTNAVMSAWGAEAAMRREALLALNPQLRATNTPTPVVLPAGAPGTVTPGS